MKSEFSNPNDETERLTSVAQTSGETLHTNAAASPLACDACVQVLHDLNNAFSGVLMNAQVLDCKLPSYSRSKRYIHEIERSAQRGNALVKRLLGHLSSECGSSAPSPEAGRLTVPPVAEHVALVASQGPTAVEHAALKKAHYSAARAAPVFGDERAECSQGAVTGVLAGNSQKGTIDA